MKVTKINIKTKTIEVTEANRNSGHLILIDQDKSFAIKQNTYTIERIHKPNGEVIYIAIMEEDKKIFLELIGLANKYLEEKQREFDNHLSFTIMLALKDKYSFFKKLSWWKRLFKKF